jgi:hypothetical protein
MTAEALARLTNFLGYGRPELVFLGIEERSREGARNLEARATSFQPVEDLRAACQKLGQANCFNPFAHSPFPFQRTPTWNAMAKVALALAGREWATGWREYLTRRLGTLDGETFLTDCFPVPCDSLNDPGALSGYRRESAWPQRKALLRSFLARSHARFIVAYGKETHHRLDELIPGSLWPPQSEENLRAGRTHDGVFLAKVGFFGRATDRFNEQDVPALTRALRRLGAPPLRIGGQRP